MKMKVKYGVILKTDDNTISNYLNKPFNRSTKYLFPLIYDKECKFTTNYLLYNNTTTYDMVNIYIDDNRLYQKKYEKCLFCLIKVSDFDSKSFREFYSNLKFHKNYMEYYNVDYGLIMLVFQLTDEDWNIVEKVIEGKYSKLPEDYKEIFRPTKPIINCLFNVMTKSKLLKSEIENDLAVSLHNDAELDDIPYKRDEIFCYT
jgi:hypothetical protein